MLYRKINVEVIVVADEADAVVLELNAALDALEEKHTIFGGGIENVACRASGNAEEVGADAYYGGWRDRGWRCESSGWKSGRRVPASHLIHTSG